MAFGKELRDYIAAQISALFDLNGIPCFFYSQGALPISVYGKLYFAPRDKMHKVGLFEDFLEELNRANQNDKALVVNSFYVADDEKQWEKMASEFYTLVRKEAQEYQECAMYLINSGCQNPSIMER